MKNGRSTLWTKGHPLCPAGMGNFAGSKVSSTAAALRPKNLGSCRGQFSLIGVGRVIGNEVRIGLSPAIGFLKSAHAHDDVRQRQV
jgi:hypothetical protein